LMVSSHVLGSSDQVISLVTSIFSKFSFISLVDILIVAALLYWTYQLIKGTRAVQIIYGILILVVIWLVAKLLQLHTLIFILQAALTMFVVAIPVVLQPELRNALFKLGRAKLGNEFTELKKNELDEVVKVLVKSCDALAKKKIGAIIVLSRTDKLSDIIDQSKFIDAAISIELILNIFTPKTPLHDGAIIISGTRIKAAGAILPLSDSPYDYHLGARHRAALGLSSTTDAVVLVVSEERGEISLSIDGILESNLSSEKLKTQLTELLSQKQKIISIK